MTMSTDHMLQLMQAARIPPICYKTSLARLSQPALRAIITDGMYRSGKELKSISLHIAAGTPPAYAATVVARFAAELVTVKAPVMYCRLESLLREIRQGLHTPEPDHRMHPVMSKFRSGFLVIPDIPAPGTLTAAESATIADFLLEHIIDGGAIILGQYADTAFLSEYETFTPEMSAYLSGVMTVAVSRPASLSTGVSNG